MNLCMSKLLKNSLTFFFSTEQFPHSILYVWPLGPEAPRVCHCLRNPWQWRYAAMSCQTGPFSSWAMGPQFSYCFFCPLCICRRSSCLWHPWLRQMGFSLPNFVSGWPDNTILPGYLSFLSPCVCLHPLYAFITSCQALLEFHPITLGWKKGGLIFQQCWALNTLYWYIWEIGWYTTYKEKFLSPKPLISPDEEIRNSIFFVFFFLM